MLWSQILFIRSMLVCSGLILVKITMDSTKKANSIRDFLILTPGMPNIKYFNANISFVIEHGLHFCKCTIFLRALYPGASHDSSYEYMIKNQFLWNSLQMRFFQGSKKRDRNAILSRRFKGFIIKKVILQCKILGKRSQRWTTWKEHRRLQRKLRVPDKIGVTPIVPWSSQLIQYWTCGRRQSHDWLRQAAPAAVPWHNSEQKINRRPPSVPKSNGRHGSNSVAAMFASEGGEGRRMMVLAKRKGDGLMPSMMSNRIRAETKPHTKYMAALYGNIMWSQYKARAVDPARSYPIRHDLPLIGGTG